MNELPPRVKLLDEIARETAIELARKAQHHQVLPNELMAIFGLMVGPMLAHWVDEDEWKKYLKMLTEGALLAGRVNLQNLAAQKGPRH